MPSFDTRDRSRVRFGALEYRSGLILTSRFRGFGGLSGLRLDAKGERFIAISDKGGWFTGRIVYKGREMTGLDDVEASPMLGPDGKPITARGWFDTEALALDGSLVYVGIERVNQMLRFDFAKGFTRARGEVVPLPPAARKLPYNKGHRGAGDGAEGPAAGGNADRDLRTRARRAGQHHRLSDRRQDARASSAIRRTDNFDVSDAVLLPSGELLLLERKFSWLGGRRHPDPAHRARLRSRPAPSSTGPRSSRPISATRSTTWKASTPTSRRRATPC